MISKSAAKLNTTHAKQNRNFVYTDRHTHTEDTHTNIVYIVDIEL